MLKRILKYLAATAIVAYVLFVFFLLSRQQEEGLCKGVIVNIADNGMEIISCEEIEDMLYKEGLDPTGRGLQDFECGTIETFMNSISLIDECQAYKSVKGYLVIDIESKKPALRIHDRNNKVYYIDNKGDIILGIPKALHLPIASGHINDSIARNELKDFANIINENEFWNSQVEQIYYDEKGKITIVPRVGNHLIEFGEAKDIDKKFDKLYTFYNEGMNNIGWNKYSKINLEFSDKIICTKRDKR